MIIYDNRDVKFILLKKSGSVLMSSMVLLPALFSTCICAAALIVSKDTPFAILSTSVARIYATLLGFVIVFRTIMAFDRFFEGVSHVQMMFSKWRDAFTSLMAFIDISVQFLSARGDVATVEKLLRSKAQLLHWFSLMSALSVQELQLGNDVPGPVEVKSQEEASEDASRIVVLQGPTNHFAANKHGDAAGTRQSGFGKTLERVSLKGGGGFFEAPRSLFSMGGSSSKIDENASGSRIKQQDSQMSVGSRTSQGEDHLRAVYVIGTITPQELAQINSSHDHVLTVIKWILLEVSEHTITGRLLIAPPILSRVYQELSNGMLAFFMAKMKIAVVPFPFPFAQVLSYALWAFYLLCPFIVLEVMNARPEKRMNLEQLAVPLLFNFATCTGYGAANEISIELEEPFGFDSNDYPVHSQQNVIVTAMEETYFCRAPKDFNFGCFGARGCHQDSDQDQGNHESAHDRVYSEGLFNSAKSSVGVTNQVEAEGIGAFREPTGDSLEEVHTGQSNGVGRHDRL